MDAPQPLKAVLRHGCTSCRSACSTTQVADVKPGDKVVARTDRGIEYAVILTGPAPVAEGEAPPPIEVLRKATAEDDRRQAEIDESGRSTEFRFCRDKVRELNLPMRLVRAERILGGQRITFYFMAEGRVDFRDLVRDLARQFKMRIELKQIGARDEAKLLGDISYCGRELCCSSWIREMRPVNMKMAKNQKSTLDPTKISGVCGRLLCCLRYEDEVYTELRKALPRRGARVTIKASGQTGLVLHQEVIASKCVVLLDRGGTVTASGEEIEVLRPGEPEA